MDYLKVYKNLIEDAINNPKSDKYKELHHILPKCMGGSNEKNNLVRLTAKQHYMAHWLLYKIYKTSELVHAWHSMSRIGIGQEERSINSRLFEYCKRERSKILSENSKGNKNNFYGKKHSDGTKKRLSEINKGKKTISQQGMRSWVEKVAKKPNSELQRQTVIDRNKNFITLQNIHTLEKVYIERDKKPEYDSEIWVNSRKITPEKRATCKYCGFVSNSGNIKRWHNENCKMKELI